MGVSITEATLLHHVCIVLFGLWFLNAFYSCHPVAYFISFIYLYLVHDGYILKLTKKIQFEEKRDSYQKRVLSDSETVRWLNLAVEKMWLVCMEEIVSKKILLPIIPWFLQKYKPWTVKDIEVQSLYLGRSPPIFTDMRIRPHSNGDDHLVMELGMNFRTADDMCSVLGVKLKKRVGFGMLAKLNLLGMHVEGKVLVGIKFLKKWPFIGRLRVCFVEPPYFQMTVKPIFHHGLDVTELPGIAGWIDNLLAVVFEQTLVEPNMLVVDVEKFISPEPETWFSVDAKESIAHAIVEVIEGVEMKPSDYNGLADPYVKGQLGPYRFRTKIQKKTLCPKWGEEFKVPISTWDSQNVLAIEVRDKDHIFDDLMGDCSVNINELRGGQRHEIWLPLQNIKTGRLHLAITVIEGNEKVVEPSPYAGYVDSPNSDEIKNSFADDSTKKGSFSSRSFGKSQQVSDKFEPIDIEGQEETGIWIHHPGSEVGQKWEPRKGKSSRNLSSRNLDGNVDSVSRTSSKNDSSSTDESTDANKSKSNNPVRKGLRKFGSLFHRNSKKESTHSIKVPDSSPRDNIKAENAKKSGVRLIVHEVPKNPIDGPEFVEQKHLNDEGKSMLMNSEDSISSVKVVLSRKASGEHEAESGLSPAYESEVHDPNSSDESLSSTDNPGNGLVIQDSSAKRTELPGNTFESTDDTISTSPQHVDSLKP